MIYKPRSGKINLNTNQKYYNDEMRAFVMKHCREYINFFGYTKVPGVENKFGFFEYENMKDDEISKAGGFAALNKEMHEWYISEKEALDKNFIEINGEGKGMQIKMNEEPMIKFQKLRHLIKMERK